MSRLPWIGLAAAMLLSAADPRIGTWKLVSAQSTLEPPIKLSITRQGRGVRVVVSGGTRMDFTAGWDALDNPVKNTPGFDKVAVRRISKNQAEIKEKKNGVVVATHRDEVSSDGKELTVTRKQRGRPEQITLWRRSGGATDTANPFIGEWSQDLGTSRMRQGLVLKIEPAGSDGVHFAGEFSYTARFDGKEHMLKDSRNDSVELNLVDAQTVESTYKRSDRIAEKDRWVISADGREMSLTTSGQLPTGEQIKETLVFRRP